MTSAPACLLEIRGVTAYYGNIVALKGVDIDVGKGEIVTLIGANGAGKSTLMMTICGNPQARDGSIVYDGRDITRTSPHQRSHAGIAHTMFQTLADKGINIQAISTSEIKVSVLIDEAYTELALRALHTAYGLDGS